MRAVSGHECEYGIRPEMHLSADSFLAAKITLALKGYHRFSDLGEPVCFLDFIIDFS